MIFLQSKIDLRKKRENIEDFLLKDILEPFPLPGGIKNINLFTTVQMLRE
jgi:hypothetical protein